MIDRIVVATKNPGKEREISRLVRELAVARQVVSGLDWPEVEETGDTLEDNALLKARTVVDATGLPALADDSGLEVAALGGRPGVKSARYAGPAATYDDNNAKLLSELAGAEDRSARFRTVVALAFPGGTNVMAEGELEGRITDEPRGGGGFGYDPVFEVDGKTLAQLSLEDKNRLSHRARAVQALAQALVS